MKVTIWVLPTTKVSGSVCQQSNLNTSISGITNLILLICSHVYTCDAGGWTCFVLFSTRRITGFSAVVPRLTKGELNIYLICFQTFVKLFKILSSLLYVSYRAFSKQEMMMSFWSRASSQERVCLRFK